MFQNFKNSNKFLLGKKILILKYSLIYIYNKNKTKFKTLKRE